MTNNQLTDAQISNATLIRLIRWADEHKSHYVAAALRELQERRKADSEPVALQPELAKVIYHFRDWNEGFPVERFKADYVISWMLANYPPAQPAPVVPDDVSIFEAAIEECKTCDSIDEHAWNHGVLAVIAKYESCRAAMLSGGKP